MEAGREVMAKLVRIVPGVGLDVVEVALENAEAAFGIRGYTVCGINRNPRHRAELQGAPVFNELLGPMYDGPGVIRYECERVNAELSA